MTCLIAMYSKDSSLLHTWCNALGSPLASMPAPFTGSILGVSNEEELDAALRDANLQAVVLHCDENSDRTRDEIHRIRSFRCTANIFIVLPAEAHSSVIDDLIAEPVDAYFDQAEQDFSLVAREITAQLQSKSKTPFADTLKSYVDSAKDAWHTPGHSGGDSLKDSPWVSDFYHFLGEHIFNADLSVSVQVLDSLLEPHSVIDESQVLAARAFGARHTFFATNGTSTANKVILQSLLSPGDKVLADRASHKSVHHGIILCGAMPVYLASSTKSSYGLYGPIPRIAILDAIDENPDARVLLLTSCTYDGLRYDLEPIIEHAHARGIKVIVDEAWFAHARFHARLRPTALESGADYATQSTHKMLSAFSQASMIHVNDPDFDEQRFREHFNMHASTSPQYSIIASLDVARKQAAMEGYKLLQHNFDLADRLHEEINATGVFRVLTLDDMLPEELENDGIQLDPTKLTVDISSCGLSSDALQLQLFEEFNIQVEKTTFNTITILLTIGTTLGKVMRLENALKRIAIESRRLRSDQTISPPPSLPSFGEVTELPRDVFFSKGRLLPLMNSRAELNEELVDQVSADQITPYPPGIPVLVPGQKIDRAILDFLKSILLAQRHTEIHGMTHLQEIPHLRIAGED